MERRQPDHRRRLPALVAPRAGVRDEGAVRRTGARDRRAAPAATTRPAGPGRGAGPRRPDAARDAAAPDPVARSACRAPDRALPGAAGAYSGPVPAGSRSSARLVLERNLNYWNAKDVKPARSFEHRRRRAPTWFCPAASPRPACHGCRRRSRQSGSGWRKLPTMSVQLLWVADRSLGVVCRAVGLVPAAMPGDGEVALDETSSRARGRPDAAPGSRLTQAGRAAREGSFGS